MNAIKINVGQYFKTIIT